MEASYQFDRYEHTTLLAALIRYSLEVAHPDECIALLEKLAPEPTQPWPQIIGEARAKQHALLAEATREELEIAELENECEGHPAGPYDPMGQTVYCDGSCVAKVAAMREP